MTGVGEVLAAMPPLPRCGLLLANPGVAVATADVFRARTGPFSAAGRAPDGMAGRRALARTRCAGQRPGGARPAVAPAIGRCWRVAALPGCLLARMSGSGATCFALFADPAAGGGGGRAAAGWWRSAGRFTDAPFTNGCSSPIDGLRLGRRQAVRQRILIPPFGGSIPPAPTSLLRSNDPG